MMKITNTVAIDADNKADYEKAVALLEAEQAKVEGWTLHKEPLINKVTAVRVQNVESL